MNEQISHLPLEKFHEELHARFVPFAGWNMPVQYTGVIPEHNAVRENAGLFDVSHMGEVFVSGSSAEKFLQYLSCNDVKKLYDGKAQYSALLNEDGGVIDDIIIYRFHAEKYLLCVNASNAAKDFAWIEKQAKQFSDVLVENKSSSYAQLALQGPKAMGIVNTLFSEDLSANIKFFHFVERTYASANILIARTGYTGEDGVEIFIEESQDGFSAAEKLARQILEIGSTLGCIPCGLGARDSLRLEAALPLHGHELAEDISALESDLAWIVKLEKAENFIGKEKLAQEKSQGSKRKLLGFTIEEPGIVRGGDEVWTATSNAPVGLVSSGTKTPSLPKAICIALLDREALQENEFFALVRGRKIRIAKTSFPFYKRKG